MPVKYFFYMYCPYQAMQTQQQLKPCLPSYDYNERSAASLSRDLSPTWVSSIIYYQ